MKIFTYLFLFLTLATTQTAFAVTATTPSTIDPTLNFDINPATFSAADYQKLTGKKMNLKERIAFVFTKRDLAKQHKTLSAADYKRAVADDSKRFNLGGFLLGFFFSLIGVLVALLFGRNVLRWAWRGFLVSFILGIVYYLIDGKKD